MTETDSEREMTWEEIKNEFENQSEDDVIYRGHGSSEWKLEPTLFRFLTKTDSFCSEKYFEILNKINCIELDLKLPSTNPLKLGLLTANKEHGKELFELFKYMIRLRHLGFPSPILDWTKSWKIAAFFAFSHQDYTKPAAIFRVKIPEPKISPYDRNIYFLNWDEIDSTETNNRHKAQEAYYTVVTQQHQFAKQPNFYSGKYEGSDLQFKKFLIRDSNQFEVRSKILKEIYDKYEINYLKLYCETHEYENTKIKDLANIHLFFKDQD